MATAPTLYWYQLDTGTLAATYFGQLNTTVAALCSENAVTAPTAPWQNSIGGTLFSKWQTQVDVAVRALCTALSVTEPIPLARGSNAGQYQSEYLESLDGVVRLLCAVPSYEGPLDLVPGAVVAYSIGRALSAAWIGENVIKLRRDSDDVTLDFVAGVDGSVDVAAVTTWLGGANGFVDTLYDQGGGAKNLIQATAALQPAWVASATNNRPAMSFDPTATQFLATVGNVTFANSAFSLFLVSKPTFATDGVRPVAGINAQSGVAAGDLFIYFQTADDAATFYCTDDDADFTNGSGFSYTADATFDDAYSLLDAAWSASASNLKYNGAATTVSDLSYGTGAPGSIAARLAVGTSDAVSPSGYFKGVIVELLPYQSSLSDGDRLALRTNIATYYGITLS